MPMTSEAAPAPQLRFGPSVPSELLFLVRSLRQQRAEGRDATLPFGRALPRQLTRRLDTLWPEPVPFWELFVVADEAGDLVGDVEPSSIANRWAAACDTMATDPPLRSEAEPDRAVIRGRLRRLHDDRRLRGRYLRFVSELWALCHEDWVRRRDDLVLAAIAECESRARRGEPWQGSLKSVSTASDILDAGWERAADRGGATVAVCAYGGSFVIDLPSTELFGMSVKDRPLLERERAAHVARRLRAVADPTRLALLQLLGERPRTIGELAVALGVAQPTVSNHVKLLREAGVVRPADGEGGRRALAVDREALGALLGETASLVEP